MFSLSFTYPSNPAKKKKLYIETQKNNSNVNLKMKTNRLPEKNVSLSTLATYFTIEIYASIEN